MYLVKYNRTGPIQISRLTISIVAGQHKASSHTCRPHSSSYTHNGLLQKALLQYRSVARPYESQLLVHLPQNRITLFVTAYADPGKKPALLSVRCTPSGPTGPVSDSPEYPMFLAPLPFAAGCANAFVTCPCAGLLPDPLCCVKAPYVLGTLV